MNNKKVIVQIFARDFQEPPRILQMCRDLSKKEFIVYRILYGGKKIKEKNNENFETIIIKKINSKSKNPSNKITFLDLFWFGVKGARVLLEINKKNKIDILHCHRHSALIPAFISKLFGVEAKIFLDYHDPWSGESTIFKTEKISLLKKIKIKIFHLFESASLNLVDNIVVVSSPQKEFIRERYKLDKDKFTIVSNSAAVANTTNFNPENKNKKIFGWENKKIILFTGCIVPYFGVDLLIDSIPLVLKKVRNALFIIKIAEEIKEKDYYEMLLKKIGGYNISKNIKFIDEWMDEEKYSMFVCSADIGIICHQPTLLTKTADPDKLYEYLSAGLPIVATNLEIMKRYVENGKNGFIVKNQKEDIAKGVIRILTNEKLRKQMGRESYKKRFDWQEDFKKLLNTYNKLIKTKNEKNFYIKSGFRVR